MSRLLAFLESRGDAPLREAHAHWTGGKGKAPRRDVLIEDLVRAMTDPEVVAERVRHLGRRLTEVLFLFLGDGRFVRTLSELRRTNPLSRLGPAEFEATLQALERRGFLFPVVSRRFRDYDEVARAVPPELGEILLDLRRRSERGPLDLLSLSGSGVRPPSKSRSKRASGKAAAKDFEEGIAALDGEMRALVEGATQRSGGIVPRSLFERLDFGAGEWDAKRWKGILERAALGTVATIDLSPYGIRLSEPTLVVFREVAEVLLRARLDGRAGRIEPASEASCGIDLVGNLSRFLGSVPSETIRYTAEGEVFRTTRRRLAQSLVTLPTREIAPEEALDGIVRFALSRRLLDHTGERTFALSRAGRAFEVLGVLEKTKRLLESALEDRSLPGSPFHQFPLRRLFLKHLRAGPADAWIEAMVLPFLVRNAHLEVLGDVALEEGVTGVLEDPQQLAWNLFAWVRRRLHPLGLVDFGYDAARRPIAIRLSPFGARVLGASAAPDAKKAGHLVVNPDFEVVVFPGEGGDFDLLHDLDRFAERLKRDALVHYRVTPESVRRGLEAGLSPARMVASLRVHSRVDLPQNVVFSIRSWSEGAGTVRLREGTLVRSERPDALDRFLRDPRVQKIVAERLSPTTALLDGEVPVARLRRLLDELGLTVEPEAPPG